VADAKERRTAFPDHHDFNPIQTAIILTFACSEIAGELACKRCLQNGVIMRKATKVVDSTGWQINVLYGGCDFLTVKSPTLPAAIAELVCHLPEKDKQALLDVLQKATRVSITTGE
jgi:hypothetical protein